MNGFDESILMLNHKFLFWGFSVLVVLQAVQFAFLIWHKAQPNGSIKSLSESCASILIAVASIRDEMLKEIGGTRDQVDLHGLNTGVEHQVQQRTLQQISSRLQFLIAKTIAEELALQKEFESKKKDTPPTDGAADPTSSSQSQPPTLLGD